MTGIPDRLFCLQLLEQFCKHCGIAAESDNITLAAHFAASTPGRLTPDPTFKSKLKIYELEATLHISFYIILHIIHIIGFKLMKHVTQGLLLTGLGGIYRLEKRTFTAESLQYSAILQTSPRPKAHFCIVVTVHALACRSEILFAVRFRPTYVALHHNAWWFSLHQKNAACMFLSVLACWQPIQNE